MLYKYKDPVSKEVLFKQAELMIFVTGVTTAKLKSTKAIVFVLLIISVVLLLTHITIICSVFADMRISTTYYYVLIYVYSICPYFVTGVTKLY